MTLTQAAIAWWRAKRPTTWDESVHLDHPAINCQTRHERALAVAVAACVKDSRTV